MLLMSTGSLGVSVRKRFRSHRKYTGVLLYLFEKTLTMRTFGVVAVRWKKDGMAEGPRDKGKVMHRSAFEAKQC